MEYSRRFAFLVAGGYFDGTMQPAYLAIPHAVNRRILLPAGATLLMLMAFHAADARGIVPYTIAFILSSTAYVWLAREVLGAALPERTVLLLLGLALVVRASFLFVLPVGSDDLFRYLWDGKVQTAGINPYLYPPNAPELATLSSELLPGSVNHPGMNSVYFPLSQWIFFLSFRLSGEAVWGFKLLLLLAEALTFSALWRLAKTLAIPRTRLLLYALCPLPIVQFAIDAHLDGLGLPLLAFALLSHFTQKRTLSLLLLGLSLAIKPVGLVFLPIMALRENTAAAKLKTLLIPLLPFALQFLPYVQSPDLFSPLLTFSRHWTFNGIFFEATNAILSNNLASRLVCVGCLGITLGILYRRSVGHLLKLYLALLALLVFSPVVHPWYVCWLVLFLPLVGAWSGIIYAATASLTAFTLVEYHSSGYWGQHPLALLGEYLPVLCLLGMELWKLRDEHATA